MGGQETPFSVAEFATRGWDEVPNDSPDNSFSHSK